VSSTTTTSVFSGIEPALRRLRAAVKVALDSKPKARHGARACAREFGFDKSIGWKVYQIGYEADAVTVLGAIPGARGWEIVLGKFAASRVDEAVVAEIKSALEAFESELTTRRIDRATLASMAAASGDTEDNSRQLLRLRKQASDALAVIFGVHANARVGGYLCMLGASTGMVDVESITMLEGLERRRPGAAWVVHEPLTSGPCCQPSDSPTVLLSDFSSKDLQPSEIAPSAQNPAVFEFNARSPERSEPLVACFAESSKHRREECGLRIPVDVPTSVCVFDVFLHKDVAKSRNLRVELYAGVAKGSTVAAHAIPVDAHVSQPTSLHVGDLSHQANTSYAAACDRSARQQGADLSHFVCHRVTIPHPPVPCTVHITWDA
jgi:hypothetical protein